MAKHSYKDVLKNCKNHGLNTRRNIYGGPKFCLACDREVKE